MAVWHASYHFDVISCKTIWSHSWSLKPFEVCFLELYTWEVRICHVCYVWLSCRSRPVAFCPNAPGVAPAALERRVCRCLSVQAVRSDYSDSWRMDRMAHRNTLHNSWPIWHFHGNWATEQLSHGKTSNLCQELVVPELCSADQVLAARCNVQ